MSETWKASRESIRRLRSALREADDNTRFDVAFWAIGLSIMAVAIVAHFGWPGFWFCVGLVIWRAGSQGLSKN